MSGEKATLTSAEELLAMAEGRRELVRGEVVEMTPAGGRNGDIAMELAFHVNAFVKENGLGKVYAAETGFLLQRDPDTVRAPDIAFVQSSRVVETDGYLPQAPDLAVEVISPSDAFSKVVAKAQMWLDHGTGLVWLVDPQTERVVVRRPEGTGDELGPGGELDGEAVLPGFRLSLSELFQ